MAAAATVAVAIRWAPSQGRRLFSSSSRSDVQQCGWPKATFVHPVAVFSGPQQWKAGHKIHKMFNGEQQNDGNDNGRVVRKPPRRSRNANGDVPESDIVRKRARQNSTSNSSGTNRGTTSSQSGGGGDDWSAFGGGGNNNNNSRRTGTTPLDLDMLLMPQMVSSDTRFNERCRCCTTGAAGKQRDFGCCCHPGAVFGQQQHQLTFSRGSDGSGGGGGALTVAAHMPWGLSTTGGGSGEGASVQHLQNLVYMAGVPQSGLQAPAATMTTAAAATWTANSGTFVSGGCGGAVVAGGMFGRASCGGSVGGASGFGGMQALPPHIRDAIERVHQRQMQKMITVQPDFADILPQCADNGMSSLGWLMLDWQADMVMGRVVGIVVLCGPFTTVSGLSGFDVRLMFDHDNPQQEMAVHCWEECMPRLANNIECGAVVEFCRLKVREQEKNSKGSFPYTLLYNNESRHRILSASSNISVNLTSSSNTPIIVEAVEQQQHRAGGSTAASARPSAAGTTAIVSTGHHHRNMPITLAQQNTGGGGGDSQDVRVAKNGNGNATDVHEQQSEDDGPNATAANLNSVGAQRVVDAEHDDDDEEGTSETAWLSTARPPSPSCTPVGRPLHRRPRRRRLLQSISPQAGPSGGHRSSPPPQRACSISAQRNLHTVVQRINDLEAQVARDERNARERRQRARRQQLLLQQHQHMPLSSSSSPSPPPRPVANAAEADVITIDDVEPLGLEPQQQLHRGDARYFAHELMTLEDEAGAAEMIILDNEPLSVADREWLISTSFKMRQLPSSVKGSVEVDENGNNNISCCICHDWLVSDADSVRRTVWPQIGRGRTPRTAPTTTTTGNGTGSGSSNAETSENHEDDDTAQLGRYCKVVGVWERTECRSRNTRCEAVEVALNGWAGARRPDTLLAQCIAHLMDRVLAGRGRPLRIGMSCQPPKFASPYHIPHRAPEQNTAAAMAAELERLAAQSAGGVDLFGGTVLFRISAVWPLERNSGVGACAADEREARGSMRCRSFFPVVNPDDTWCLARAVVLGLADRHFQHLYGADSQQATAHLRTFWLAQHGHGGEQAARQLLQSATLSLDRPSYGVADAQRLQHALDTRLGAQHVRLVIFEREHGCCVLWKAPNRAHFNICLLLQRNAHYGYIQRPQQLFRAKQYCVECERPVHRWSHPLGCRAVCGLCLRYDALHFPCRREADTPQGGLFCAQCRFVFPNADCFAAHRQCVDPPPALGLLGGGGGGGGAVVDRRRGRPYRSMCEERRLCAQCNVVVWARSGAHHCRRQQPLQQHVRAIATASTSAPMAPTTAAAAATVATVAAVGQQQQQQQHHCQKCGGPHDASRTPHFVQPKQFARQCQWQQHNTNGIADDVQGDHDEEGEDNESDGEEEEEGADATRGQRQQQRRDNKAVRFIFWDVECAQERVVQQQQQQQRQQQILQEGVADEWAADGGEDDDDDAGGIGDGEAAPAAFDHAVLLKHVPVLVCAEVICERCIAHGVELEREPLRRAPRCQCGVPWRGANRRRWCSRIGEQQFDDNGVDIEADELDAVGRQLPPDGLNPRRLRFFCDGEPGTGRGAMEQFVDFLLHTGPKGVRTVMLAHNGGRYDIHLLLEELQRRGERPRRAVQHGLRVYMLELRGTHQRELICKDSLNYFHCALATLPRTFGLRGVPDKPFFPYHHIHARNLDVELPAGTLPPPAAYDPDRMRAEQRERFMEWYAHELRRPGRQPFLLRRELLRYCWNDVKILRTACLRFRELVGECADGMEPFLAATTIASLAMAVFRQHHLRPNTMVHTPEGGFLRGRRASVESRRFFTLLAAVRPDLGPLRTARWSIGEAVVGDSGRPHRRRRDNNSTNSCAGADDDGFRLDCVAYRHPPLRPLCIEFNGCYMHGCRECYPDRHMLLAGGRSAELLWARTQQRAWELAELHGMEVLSVWECHFRRTLRTNTRLRKLYKERCVDVPGPLDLRKHALFGGRVEPFWLLHKCAPDEEIVYIDIVSLYPYCMKARPFPIGTPHVWTGEQLWQAGAQVFEASAPPPAGLCPPPALPWRRPEDNPFRGFLFCRVLPPTAEELGDREPLLPYRTQADGRLIFGLCSRCAELRQQRICHHAERERAWTAAYTHAELNRALSIGYRVLNVHEVWHYERWASLDNGNGLFTEYVNTFLRLKAEASGWPAGCDTEAARAEHIRQFAEQEGIHHRPDNIGHNPGLRQLAKDLLNSLWGKMAERPERDEVVYTNSARDFHELLMRPEQEVVSFTHLNDQLDRCVVRKREPFARAPEHNNLAVACFVTSHARLYLYDWLEEVRRVGGRSLYCDTDSVLYVKQCGAEGVREGNALGDMKRELPGRRIIDFFAAGPKNYGFQHVDACTGGDLKAERKVRSFELNYAADQQLQYERMRQLVINHFGSGQQHQQQQQQRMGHTADAADGSDGQEERTISVPCQRFVRNRQADIFTSRSTRVYRPVYTKGRVLRRGAAECVDEVPPQSIRTRPFGWNCCAGGVGSSDSSVMNEEEEEEEPMQMAPSAADRGEEDRWREHVWPNDIGDNEDDDEDDEPGPERKRARVEQCVAPPSPPPSPLREPDAEPEPVAGCSTWDQTTRHTKHICRNNF
ncbi:hypothetical protein niasHS_005322 [Heterodera schachtii]|uniref:DNA-directed DNA polymerase n=1 Tax=Heterodera schachtii TaxID=97005 RepID=A0ABD2J9A0_HETSC